MGWKIRTTQPWRLLGRIAIVASLLLVCATISGASHLGEAAVPFLESVEETQAVVVVIACALVLSAVFAQHWKVEADLRERVGRQAKQIVTLTCVHEAASR